VEWTNEEEEVHCESFVRPILEQQQPERILGDQGYHQGLQLKEDLFLLDQLG
jgi:hypothetical protein